MPLGKVGGWTTHFHLKLSLLFLSLGASACSPSVEKEWDSFLKTAKNTISINWAILTGTGVPAPSSPKGAVSPSPEDASGLTSNAARTAQANSELFHEMFNVVFMREPRDRSEFGNWVDTLNQGASLEGVHNGLIRSSDYRELETKSVAATVYALNRFAEELAVLELDLPEPTEFDPLSGAPKVPADVIPTPLASPSGGFERDSVSPPPPKVEREVALRNLSQKYIKTFVTGSVYKLKRTLAEEALRVVGFKGEFKEQLALWYSRWVVHMASLNVDFGIPLRNNANEAFHYKWALETTQDRIGWEVLNRLHRVMNEANRPKQ
ncbi:MAG: hypothetical protein HYX41_00310 [Bdellovibrio sp.]|nr:hypothetical protein [Bdellovibrio sp.]